MSFYHLFTSGFAPSQTLEEKETFNTYPKGWNVHFLFPCTVTPGYIANGTSIISISNNNITIAFNATLWYGGSGAQPGGNCGITAYALLYQP